MPRTLIEDTVTVTGTSQADGTSLPRTAPTLLVLGGRSDIGIEIAERMAPGHRVILAARRSSELREPVERVSHAGAISVHAIEFDADDLATHAHLVAGIVREFGSIDVVVLAFGILGDQARAEIDPAHAVAIVHTDYVAQVSMLTVLAAALREQGRGIIVVFSSVAGARVRRANYVYGSAKAGLDGFASGLGDALHGSGVRVVLVRPGFVVGRMTAGMDPAPLSSTPSQVAEATVRALRSSRSVVWVPWALQPLFFALRLLPQRLWRRMPR